MDKTIINLPEATEVADDDYIVLDGENGGPCKILATDFVQIISQFDGGA